MSDVITPTENETPADAVPAKRPQRTSDQIILDKLNGRLDIVIKRLAVNLLARQKLDGVGADLAAEKIKLEGQITAISPKK